METPLFAGWSRARNQEKASIIINDGAEKGQKLSKSPDQRRRIA
jgi:hypothetical protein